MRASGSFVQIPTSLIDALMRSRLSGRQWRILLWVMRHTLGWHRAWTAFTWYRIAKALHMDRPGAFRAGRALLEANVLVVDEHELGLQMDSRLWDWRVFEVETGGAEQLWMPEVSVVQEQSKPLSPDNATVVTKQRKRCQETTLFRRAKDSRKERLNIYKETRVGHGSLGLCARIENTEHRLLAGAAKPIPRKYERLSQN